MPLSSVWHAGYSGHLMMPLHQYQCFATHHLHSLTAGLLPVQLIPVQSRNAFQDLASDIAKTSSRAKQALSLT